MNLLKKVLLLCLSGALVISSNLGRADDIEIYFNSGNFNFGKFCFCQFKFSKFNFSKLQQVFTV